MAQTTASRAHPRTRELCCEEDWDPGGGCSADSGTEQVTVSSCKAVGRLSCRAEIGSWKTHEKRRLSASGPSLLCSAVAPRGRGTQRVCTVAATGLGSSGKQASGLQTGRPPVSRAPVPEANTGMGAGNSLETQGPRPPPVSSVAPGGGYSFLVIRSQSGQPVAGASPAQGSCIAQKAPPILVAQELPMSEDQGIREPAPLSQMSLVQLRLQGPPGSDGGQPQPGPLPPQPHGVSWLLDLGSRSPVRHDPGWISASRQSPGKLT